MAHVATDGKKFTNRPPMMAHNRSLESKSEAGGAGMRVDPLAQPQHEEMGGEDGASVAAEHGPAHEVHIMHDHEGGKHHVHSMHPDGHEHHSEHGSAEEAHDHAKELASSHDHEEPDGDEMGEEPEYE